ncbi:Tigger transposable element-derived protein 6 [Dictyocoela muelleri]|nr:Tigger transposable element-derived protein 6 [Dictyocoela muelleri]
MIIGKYSSPRGFKNIDFNKLGLEYTNNSKSWMTREIFDKWLDKLNRKMSGKNRKILLILDNATVHNIRRNFSNIELYFLPKNCTSMVQPLDQCIIRSFKENYRKYLARENTLYDDGEKSYCEIIKNFKIINSLNLIMLSWEIVTKETIINCCKKAFQNWNVGTEREISQNVTGSREVNIEFNNSFNVN